MVKRFKAALFSLAARRQRVRKDWVSTSRLFLAAAEASGSDWRLWYEAGRALEYAKDPRAIEAFAKATLLPGADSDCWYRYGRCLEISKNSKEALAAYVRAEENGGRTGHLAFRQARCLEEIGESVAAAVKFRRAADNGFDPRQCFQELLRLQGSGSPRWLRLDLYREGQEHFESDSDWTLAHAKLASEMGFPDEAREFYTVASSVRVLSVENALRFANSLKENGERGKAKTLLLESLQTNMPEAREAGIGALYQSKGYLPEAREEYFRELEQDPRNPDVNYRLGLSFDREYRWIEAQRYLKRAIELRPGIAYWEYKYAHACERAGDFEDAAFWYWSALRNSPTKTYWWYRLGVCLVALGQTQSAIRALQNSMTAVDSPQRNVGLNAFTDSAETDPSRELIERMYTLATGSRTGQAPVPDLLSIGELASRLGHTGELEAISRKFLAKRYSLDVSNRSEAATLLAGEFTDQAVEVLLSSRLVRRPDGVDLKKYLPKGGAYNSRLYAEFVSSHEVDDYVVLFEANHGASASCHPLALYRSMTLDPRFEGCTFVWALNDTSRAPIDVREDDRVEFVRVGSESYLYHLATAKHLINNVSFPPYFVRRLEQRYLNTWHGTPMKTLGRSMKQGLVEYENLERNFLQSTHLMAPNELSRWAILDEHHLNGIYPGAMGIVGSPRLDRLVSSYDDLRSTLRSRLNVADDEKLVLVAPTWRGGVSSRDLDAESLFEQLHALASIEGVRVFYRAHRLTESLVTGLDLPVEIVPPDIDTNELLAAVDHLVSDYSSVVFDFMVTRKPITLYVPDLREYEEERGLYVQPHDLPVGVASSPRELVADVASGGIDRTDRYADAIAEFCRMEDGAASKRCVDFFLSDDSRGNELNGRPTIAFHASLMPNGIASALLAILGELVALDVNVLLVVEPSVLRNAPDRETTFKRLPSDVRLVSRVGGAVMTPEEFYIRGVVESQKAAPSEEMLSLYRTAWTREARRITGDIPIHASVEWDGYATLWAGIMSHIGSDKTRRLIWQHNDMSEEEAHKYPELGAVFRMYSWFDKVVSVSDLLARKNQEHFGPLDMLPGDFVFSVPNSLPFDEIRSKASEPLPPLLEEAKQIASHLVVTVGRLSMEKNQVALVRAWRDVRDEFPEARLLLVGSGPLEDTIFAEIDRLGLQDAVTLVGQVQNPYPLIRSASLFVLPSLHEGQPVVLFEAMALGVPVAASACPGNLEAMGKGYGSVLPTSADELGRALILLLRQESGKGAFDAEGYRKASIERFCNVIDLPMIWQSFDYANERRMES